MYKQYNSKIATQGRGIYDITNKVSDVINQTSFTIGLCHIFIKHTSASLIICENHDPQVQADLEAFMLRLIPDGDDLFKHIEEGPDDMPSHVRSILTSSFLTIPITDKKLALGTWQGLYLWEHRHDAKQRELIITVHGQ